MGVATSAGEESPTPWQVAWDQLSEHVLRVFTTFVEREPAVRERFIEHYTMWKILVDDPRHPDHRKVRRKNHADPTFTAAYKPTPGGFAPNQRCHCRSGKKFKNCCGRAAAADDRR